MIKNFAAEWWDFSNFFGDGNLDVKYEQDMNRN